LTAAFDGSMDSGSGGGGSWQRCSRNNSDNASAMRALVRAQRWQRRQQQRQWDKQQPAGATKGREGGQEEWVGERDARRSGGGQGTAPSDGRHSFLRLLCDLEFSRRPTRSS